MCEVSIPCSAPRAVARELRRASAGEDDSHAQCSSDAERSERNPSRTQAHQPLPGLQPGELDQRAIRGHRRARQTRAFRPSQVRRQSDECARVGDEEFSQRAIERAAERAAPRGLSQRPALPKPREDRAHAISHMPTLLLLRRIALLRRRRRMRAPKAAFAADCIPARHHHVARIERDRAHADHDLTRTTGWIGTLFEPQIFRNRSPDSKPTSACTESLGDLGRVQVERRSGGLVAERALDRRQARIRFDIARFPQTDLIVQEASNCAELRAIEID